MKTKLHLMKRLRRLSIIISNKRNENPYSKFVALRKLFVQEKRVWPSGKQVGWKRGEIFELFTIKDFTKEWGDVGYYIASSYRIFILLYCLITPNNIIESAVNKFSKRAFK